MRRFLALPILVALLLSGGIAAAMSNTVQKTTKAGPYKLVLKIGPPEKMSMKKGSGGEMMLGGKKATCTYKAGSMMTGMRASKTCNHHLEVHIYNKSSGKVVQHATVAIAMVDTKNHKTVVVPVMTMMGSQGMMDYHYGNNIYAGPGPYRVTVRVNKTMATFSVTLM